MPMTHLREDARRRNQPNGLPPQSAYDGAFSRWGSTTTMAAAAANEGATWTAAGMMPIIKGVSGSFGGIIEVRRTRSAMRECWIESQVDAGEWYTDCG